MVVILGVNPMTDASACLVIDGVLVNYVERERFEPRWKHSRKYDLEKDRVILLDPIEAIKWCLEDTGITMDKVDYIVLSWKAEKESMKRLYDLVPYEKEPDRIEWEKRCLEKHSPEALMADLKQKLEEAELTPVPDMVCVPHHLAHAATAYASGWEKCAILTVDGHGDTTAIAGWIKDGGEIKQVFWHPFWNSLGWFYSAVTEFLGLKMKCDETKVMNLSNYAEVSPILKKKMDKVVKVKKGDVEVDASYLLYGPHKISENPRYSDKFIHLFGEPFERLEKHFKTIGDVKESRAAQIAAAAQAKLEEAMLALCYKLLYKLPIEENIPSKLVLAGGIALNCKANSRILREKLFSDVFVLPAAHDGGTAVGAALYWYWHETNKDPTFELEHAYYGPEYSNKEIEEFLESQEVDFYEVEPVAKAVELLLDNQIVAWFQGRREMGPRALMNTSILADPRDKRNFYRINVYHKKSVLWRDRSPSVTYAFAREHFDEHFSKLDPFMLGLRKVDDSIPAVTSVRGETRPQIIDHPILTLLEEEIGFGCVLNTSFNQAGKAMVNSPQMALEDAKAMKLQHLIIGDFYINL
ncbi:hypothetical protein DRP04_01765 [Archaeoglobales archaeon]|nr:MAG: hypothetical protein DRP04_01765 [Archaeoglobales archaeon]